jgi:hypothetical protein
MMEKKLQERFVHRLNQTEYTTDHQYDVTHSWRVGAEAEIPKIKTRK